MCYVLSDVPCLKLRFHSNMSVGCYVRRFVNITMKRRRDKGVVDLMIDLVASEKQLNKKLCPKLHPEFLSSFYFRKGSLTSRDCDVERCLLVIFNLQRYSQSRRQRHSRRLPGIIPVERESVQWLWMEERPLGTIPAGNCSVGGFVNRAVTKIPSCDEN